MPRKDSVVQIVSLAEYARAQAASYYDQNDEAAIAFRHIANCIDDAISKAYEAGKEAGARQVEKLVMHVLAGRSALTEGRDE